MSDTRIFKIDGLQAQELKGSSVALEKSLQTYMERNLEPLLSIKFLASEYSTGKTHRGRIDTLGIDENGCPVIIEYKRTLNENVINQGLFYLDWLLDHQAEFELHVQNMFGADISENIEWGNPRLICIAGDFTRYDIHAVQQIERSIELIRYQKYEDSLLLLELVNATGVQNTDTNKLIGKSNGTRIKSTSKSFSEYLNQCDTDLQNLYDDLKTFIEALGDDVQIKILKNYIAFKRLKNFACVEVHPQAKVILAYVKSNPDNITLESGFTRDVQNIGHYGTGDLEIRIKSHDDLKKAEDLIRQSYEDN
jgi:predicted transport protein